MPGAGANEVVARTRVALRGARRSGRLPCAHAEWLCPATGCDRRVGPIKVVAELLRQLVARIEVSTPHPNDSSRSDARRSGEQKTARTRYFEHRALICLER
jgi:hypothetical protein